jgi:hypothetical protein
MGRPRGDYSVLEAAAVLEQASDLAASVPRDPSA